MLNKSFKIYIAIIFVIIITGTIFYFSRNDKNLPREGEKKINLAKTYTKTYTNNKIGFSFSYPDEFTVGELAEEGKKTVLTIQNTKTGEGLQIYITVYDDPSFSVSVDRIKSDIPDLPILNASNIIAGGKAKGVAFFSQNEAFGGPTAEVWFADGKNFYQATVRAGDAKLLEEIVKSWKLK